MKELDVDRINESSPYLVGYLSGRQFTFVTDYGVEYSVDFDNDNNPYFTAYLFNLTNRNHKRSPGDKKIAETVICIIEEFF